MARCHPSDVLDLGAGVELRVEPGDVVEVGQEWAVIHHNRDIPRQLLSGLKLTTLKTSYHPLICFDPELQKSIEINKDTTCSILPRVSKTSM